MRVCGSSLFVCWLVGTGTVLGTLGIVSEAGVIAWSLHNGFWWRITRAPGSMI